VKAPRLRIALVMLIIAIAGLNFGAIRAVSNPGRTSLFLLCLVVLPMANILAGGLLLAILRPSSRPFLRGFELFGVIAIALVVAGVTLNESILLSYLNLSIFIDVAMFGPPSSTGPNGLSFCILSLWAIWPQLVFAGIGGLLFSKIRAAVVPD
jgi:hypothetical protein